MGGGAVYKYTKQTLIVNQYIDLMEESDHTFIQYYDYNDKQTASK